MELPGSGSGQPRLGPRDERLVTKTLWQTLVEDGRFSRFLATARTAELENNLQGPDWLTVFAVPDEALQSENEDVLKNVVAQHVVHGMQTEADLRTASTLRSLAGPPVTVSWEDAWPQFGNARVLQGTSPARMG